jgi:hypothetical protein
MNNVRIHTKKDQTWTNAAQDIVPVKFVPQSDKRKEELSGTIYKAALAAETSLKKLYTMMDEAFKEVTHLVKQEYELAKGKAKKQGKGSFTFYNFDKSLKVEAEVNDIVKWDASLMTEALGLLNKYINASLTDSNELIRSLVNDAFSNRNGQIDSRKIFQLLKYESKIKNGNFLKACELIKNGQSIDRTKLYMRVWEKDEKGEYRNINLNFSSL